MINEKKIYQVSSWKIQKQTNIIPLYVDTVHRNSTSDSKDVDVQLHRGHNMSQNE